MKLISPVKNALLCFLFLTALLAVPVQSQTILTNPDADDLLPCGLPTSESVFTSAATYRTFELTANCTITAAMVGNDDQYMYFQDNSGEFTINGNGYTITGPPNATLFIVGYFARPGAAIGAVVTPPAILNLNDVTISGVATDRDDNTPILAHAGGRFNATNVIFSGNSGDFILDLFNNASAYLTDIQVLNNRIDNIGSGRIIFRSRGRNAAQIPNTLLVITNARFEGNTNVSNILWALQGTIQLRGTIIFCNNTHDAGQQANHYGFSTTQGGVVDDQSDTRGCPPPPKRKKKEEARPTPTPTPRPAYGASYVALQTATGMTFEATYGLDSGVHFRQLDGAGIGVQSIIDAGYLAALDVYGYVEQGVEVCFPQIGRVIFLDARTMPRAITPLEATVRDGMTCASISSPGSLVLMPN